MRAVAVLPRARAVRVVDVAAPRCEEPDQVLLRVLDVGVCGTDKEICAFEYGTPPAGEELLILGHECLAVIEEVGAAVTDLAVGDLVIPSVRRPCDVGGCAPCRSGHQDFCASGRFTERGIKEAHGFMAELVVERARYLTAVPRELRDVAVLTEPLTIAQKALEQVFSLMAHRPPWLSHETPVGQRGRGMQALVLGVGPVGVLGAMSLVAEGFTTFVYSREQPPSPRIDLVEAVGASYRSTELTSFDDLVAELGNVDLVYEAVGSSHFALEGLAVLGTNGVFVLTGVPGVEDLVHADPAHLMREMVLRNQVLLGTVNAGAAAFKSALALLEATVAGRPGVVDSMLAGRFSPEEAAEVIHGRQMGLKSVISFSVP